MDLSLSLFFPAYNEEDNIEQSVMQADAILKEVAKTYEIIVVNDGSKDKTGPIADQLSKKNSHVRVVHHPKNQGYGAAVYSGLHAARYDYVFFTDADLQFNLHELKQLTKYVPEYQAVLGYRAKRRDPFMRLANAKGWNALNRALFGLRVKDIDCAFKLLDRNIVKDLPIKSRGAMVSAELLIRLQRMGVRFKEVPVTHLPRRQGSPTGARPDVIMRAFRELFSMYRGELGNVTHREAVKFAIVGGVNTVIDIILYFLLTRFIAFFGDHLLVAKAFSFGTASISSFIANRRWTFRRKSPLHFMEIVRFYTTVAIAVVINVACLSIFLRLYRAYDLPAVITATFFTFAWNFFVSKFWVFRQTEQHDQTTPASKKYFLWGIALLLIVTGLMTLYRPTYIVGLWNQNVRANSSEK